MMYCYLNVPFLCQRVNLVLTLSHPKSAFFSNSLRISHLSHSRNFLRPTHPPPPLHYPPNSAILLSVILHVHTSFQSQFSTECDLVLPLSIFSTFSLPEGQPVAAYIFFLVFPPLLLFPLSLLQQCVLEGSAYARCDQSSWPSFFVLYVGCFSHL